MSKEKDKYAPDSDFVRNLEQDITVFIKKGGEESDTEEEFNQLALRLFEFQFNANPAYQKYCKKRGATPEKISSWMQIPAVPTSAFKEIPLCTFPSEQAIKVLTSSGTTDQSKRSTLYYDELGLRMLHLSGLASMEKYLFVEVEKARPLLMAPPLAATPNLALAYYIPMGLKGHMAGEPQHFITADGLDMEGLADALKAAEDGGVPVILLGATFGYVHFIGFCKSKGISFKLPEGSILQDGGGYKGQSREIPKEDFIKMVQETLGLPAHHIVNSYGASEISCGFIDNVLYNHVKGIDEPRYKLVPHWARTVVVDPDTLEPLPKGKSGLLRHYCLGNVSNVMGVQTDDIGYEIGTGFEVTGRAKGAEARGCSIAMDELISAQSS